jgi:hypothetical protein
MYLIPRAPGSHLIGNVGAGQNRWIQTVASRWSLMGYDPALAQ